MKATNWVVVVGCICILFASVGGTAVGASQSSSSDPIETTENFVTVQTTYPTDGPSEAVNVVVEISPEGETINDIYLNISNSDTGYVDFESFSISITPSGAADIEEQFDTRGGERVQSYHISELTSGETVEVSFTAYPTNIRPDRRSVATVSYQYLQNAQEVPEDGPGSIQAIASFDQSPYSTVNSLQTQVQGMWVTTGVGVLAGVVGLAIGGFLFYRSKNPGSTSTEDYTSVRRELTDAKRDLKNVTSSEDLDPATRADIEEALEEAIEALK